jgi:hypothetical protein
MQGGAGSKNPWMWVIVTCVEHQKAQHIFSQTAITTVIGCGKDLGNILRQLVGYKTLNVE